MPSNAWYRFRYTLWAPHYDRVTKFPRERRHSVGLLRLQPGERLLIIGCGTGADLAYVPAAVEVLAVDLTPAMLRQAMAHARPGVELRVMDGMALDFPNDAFDAALSVLGIILFPDAVKGLREMHRVVRPGGRLAVVTWTQPHRYELAAHLREAILSLRSEPAAPADLPAQLRFVDAADFERLFAEAGIDGVAIEGEVVPVEKLRHNAKVVAVLG